MPLSQVSTALSAVQGVSLRLAVSEPAVTHLFTITGATWLMDICPTVATALIS